MFYKNVLAIALLTQTLSIYATSPIQENKDAQTVHITVTQSPAEQKQEAPEVRTFVSTSIETLQADNEFCLKTLSDDASDINALSPSGKTTLHLLTLSFLNNFDTKELIAYALKRGANVNAGNESGKTPLFFVTAYALCSETFAATQNPLHDRTLNLSMIELLLAFNADPTITDTDGWSPLLLAVAIGDQEMMELFVRYGLMERIFQAEAAMESSMEASVDAQANNEETTK